MQSRSRVARHGAIAPLLFSLAVMCQAQSLGEVARQEKAKKLATPSTQRHVITNEDLHPSATTPAAADVSQEKGGARKDSSDHAPSSTPGAEQDAKPSAEEVKAKVLAQKQVMSSLEAEINKVEQKMNELDQALKAGGDCRNVFIKGTAYQNVCGIAEKLIAEKKRLESRLEQERTTLEEMQEEARHMGYGNAVYDPDPD
jgi:chromosome segregation ATPase